MCCKTLSGSQSEPPPPKGEASWRGAFPTLNNNLPLQKRYRAEWTGNDLRCTKHALAAGLARQTIIYLIIG